MKIKLEIDRLIAEDLPFEALEAETKEVVELFRQHYFEDKEGSAPKRLKINGNIEPIKDSSFGQEV